MRMRFDEQDSESLGDVRYLKIGKAKFRKSWRLSLRGNWFRVRRSLVLGNCLLTLVAFLAGAHCHAQPGSPTPDPPRIKFDFEKHGAIVYHRTDEFLVKCDVYQPVSEMPLPAIMMIHGGAWRSGTKFTMLRHARRMARAGYVVVAINYRLAPAWPWPAQLHDCRTALAWMADNAAVYNIDPDRIGVFGYSAGGHLAAMLTLAGDVGFEEEGEATVRPLPEIRAAAIGGTPAEFSWIDPDANSLKYWLGGSREEFPDRYLKASPVTHASAGDPPMFLFHGTTDWLVPPESSQRLHEALVASGVDSTMLKVEGHGHVTTFSKANLLRTIIPFFDRYLKKGESGPAKAKPNQ